MNQIRPSPPRYYGIESRFGNSHHGLVESVFIDRRTRLYLGLVDIDGIDRKTQILGNIGSRGNTKTHKREYSHIGRQPTARKTYALIRKHEFVELFYKIRKKLEKGAAKHTYGPVHDARPYRTISSRVRHTGVPSVSEVRVGSSLLPR